MNKLTFGIIITSMVLILGVGTISAFPLGEIGECGQERMIGSDHGQNLSEEEMSAMQEQMQSIQDAIENNDYNEWKSLMTAQLTEEKFEQLVEMQNLASEKKALMDDLNQAWEDENYDKVKEIQEEMKSNMPERPENGDKPSFQKPPMKQSFWNRLHFW